MVLVLLVFPLMLVFPVWGQNGPVPANTLTAEALKAGPEVANTLPAESADREFATLMPFGHEFFQSATSGAATAGKTTAATTPTTTAGTAPAPGQSIPVPMQYRVGPEDKVSLVLSGGINARYELIVDGNGRIDIPRIGSVFVGGMTFEEMSKQVIKKTEETAGLNVDISMNAMKTFPVSVRGEVRRPGPHTVGAFATITDALISAGGPSERGTVRNVQVRRKGITVASFDLYDLLLKGSKSKDITLMAGDEVFVPVRGPAVGIAGSVRQPAVYELKDRDDLENLIGLAGGVIASPSLTPIPAAEATQPRDIQGTLRHTERPAPAQTTGGKQIKEAQRIDKSTRMQEVGRVSETPQIQEARRTQEVRWIQVERITGNERKVIYDVSIQDLNQRKSFPPSLQDRDLVRVSPLAFAGGAVAAAAGGGTAGGATPAAAVVATPGAAAETVTGTSAAAAAGVSPVPLDGNVASGQSVPAAAGPTAVGAKVVASTVVPPVALDGKVAVAPAASSPLDVAVSSPGKFVTLSGEFKRPGRYPIRKGEKLSSVIERAGGYTNNAYLRGAYFTRESVRQSQQQNLNDMADRIAREIIPPGEYATAFDSGTVGAPVAGARSISTFSDAAAASPSAGTRPGDIGPGPRRPAAPPTMKADELELKQRFVAYMKSLKATGRLTITIAHLRLLKGSTQDVELEEGDILHLPQNGNVVSVIGGVMSEGPHIYDDKWDYREYVSAAGGYARYADEPNVFAIKVDGGVRRLPRGFIEWSNRNDRWEITAFGQEIKQTEAGDVIVVPEKLTHIAWLKQVRDLNQLLMNTAVLTGTALRLW